MKMESHLGSSLRAQRIPQVLLKNLRASGIPWRLLKAPEIPSGLLDGLKESLKLSRAQTPKKRQKKGSFHENLVFESFLMVLGVLGVPGGS